MAGTESSFPFSTMLNTLEVEPQVKEEEAKVFLIELGVVMLSCRFFRSWEVRGRRIRN